MTVKSNAKPLTLPDGVLLLDKPEGMSSHKAIQVFKRTCQYRGKVGHTGSLDPLATGMLPLVLGEATKYSQFLLMSDKRYEATMQLGVATETGDLEGAIRETREVPGDLSLKKIEAVLEQFRGPQQQVPSMYSALKHQGEPLYKLARAGITVDRPARDIMIHHLKLLKMDLPFLQIDVSCSKGTYIRTLAEDIGEALGVGAHVTQLRRTEVAGFKAADMITLDMLEASEAPGDYVLSMSEALISWPKLSLAESLVFYLKQGQAVLVPKAPVSGWVRLHDVNDQFFGMGEILDDGRVAPRRLLRTCQTA